MCRLWFSSKLENPGNVAVNLFIMKKGRGKFCEHRLSLWAQIVTSKPRQTAFPAFPFFVGKHSNLFLPFSKNTCQSLSLFADRDTFHMSGCIEDAFFGSLLPLGLSLSSEIIHGWHQWALLSLAATQHNSRNAILNVQTMVGYCRSNPPFGSGKE